MQNFPDVKIYFASRQNGKCINKKTINKYIDNNNKCLYNS